MTRINVTYFNDSSLKLWFDSRTKLNTYTLGNLERRIRQLIIFMSATQYKEYFTLFPWSCKLFYLTALNVTDFNKNHSVGWKQGLWVQASSYYKTYQNVFFSQRWSCKDPPMASYHVAWLDGKNSEGISIISNQKTVFVTLAHQSSYDFDKTENCFFFVDILFLSLFLVGFVGCFLGIRVCDLWNKMEVRFQIRPVDLYLYSFISLFSLFLLLRR